MDFIFLFFLVMKFCRVTLKLMSIALRNRWTWLLALYLLYLNNFSYTNLILSVSLWNWWLYLSVTIKNLGDNLFIALLLSFNALVNLQIGGWCTTIIFEICYAYLPLCLSYDCPSVLICKHSKFLVEILELRFSASATPSMDVPFLNLIHYII